MVRYFRLRAFFFGCALCCSSGVSAQDGNVLPLKKLLNVGELEQRDTIKEFVEQQLRGEDVAGAAANFRGRDFVFLPIQSAVLEGLRKKLAVQIARDNVDVSRQLIREAEAVFDPTFSISLGYSRSNTHRRTKYGYVNTKAFGPINGPASAVDIPPAQNDLPHVIKLGFRTFKRQTAVLKVITANSPKEFGDADDPTTLTVGVSQQLPWGPSLSIAVAPSYHHRAYDDLGNSFNADFTSKGVLSLAIPIPGTKDFGPLATQDVAIKQAHIEDERRGWEVKSLINTSLRDINTAYWEQVRAIENLHVAIENRKLVEEQVASTRRLFDARVATSYDKSLVEEELATAILSEEIARNLVVAVGHALTGLIEDSEQGLRKTVYFPVDYMDYLTSTLEFDAQGIVDRGLKNRPDLLSRQVSSKASNLNRDYFEQQTKANLWFATTWTSKQKGQDAEEYGYQKVWDSMRHTVKPDSLDQNFTLSYTRPALNRSANAQYASARYSAMSQRHSVSQARDLVVADINNALSAVASARRRVESANETVKLSQFALDRLQRRREVGGSVGALELLTTVRAVLNAKLARVSALVDNKIAEIQLLHADGSIAHQYPEQLARNDFEKRRLALLSENNALSWFSLGAAN